MRLLILFTLLFGMNAQAEENPLKFLQGEWNGESHQTNRDGTVSDMQATECVYPKHINQLGSLGIVEGRHINKKTGELLFGTYAVLSKSAQPNQYRFSIYLSDGTTREAVANIDPEKQLWIWSMDLPLASTGGIQIAIRYTIRVVADEWIEIGETTRNSGKSWNKFFEMNLKKTSDICSGF